MSEPLIPAAIAARLPDGLTVREARRAQQRIRKHLEALAEAIDSAPLAAAITFTERCGSVGAELRGGLDVVRQGNAALAVAIERNILEQRRSLAAQGRQAIEIRKHLAKAGISGGAS